VDWAITAPFTRSVEERWLAPFVPGSNHTFSVIPRVGAESNWHSRASRRSGPAELSKHALQAHRAARQAGRHGGIITVFPQLAVMAGLEKRARRRSTPILAWFFDTELDSPFRTAVSRHALRSIDRFVVHTRCEREVYSKLLGLPIQRFQFVPLQYGGTLAPDDEDQERPFVFTTGSGFRDYPTFFEAIRRVGVRTVVCSGERALAGTTPPRNVEIRNELTRDEIHSHMRRARVNVLPMRTDGVTAGGITIAETFRHGRGLIATDRPGLSDYLLDAKNCITVRPYDATDLADAIDSVWHDDELRSRLNEGALEFAEQLTDEAAGAAMGEILDELAAR
jgi:hypothetical protein